MVSDEFWWVWDEIFEKMLKITKQWCEALFEKTGCRKFALILEKPKTGQNLPTPLSWDAKLISTGKLIESRDSLKMNLGCISSEVSGKFQLIWRGLPRKTFPKRVWKCWKNYENHEKSKISKSIRDHLWIFPELQELISDGFWWVLMSQGCIFRLRKNLEKYHGRPRQRWDGRNSAGLVHPEMDGIRQQA